MRRNIWIWPIGVSLLFVLLLQVPYVLGYLAVPNDQFYTGLIMNPEDSQTYWAKMTQGLNGAWAYTIPFTPEPHDAAYVGIFYVWLGQLARLTGVGLTTVWHTSRVISALLLGITVYGYIGLFIPVPQNSNTPLNPKKFAFLLSLFGSGLGWVLFLLQQPLWLGAFPVDFKQPGAHLFFTAMTFPHITLGTALILVSTAMLKRIGSIRDSRPTINHAQSALILGVSNLLLAIAYPFLIYIVAGTAAFYGLYLFWQRRIIPWAYGILGAIGFLIPAPLYLYYAQVLRVNSVFKAWDVQAVTPSAPWPHYLVAFGPYLLLVAVHWRGRKESSGDTAVLYAWLLTVALLLYAPLNPQRRFIQGVQVPLSILSALAIVGTVLPGLIRTGWWQRIVARPRYETRKLARLLTIVFLLFMSLSNIYLLADVARTAALVQPDPLFRSVDELDAVAWLQNSMTADDTLLGSMQTGNLVAARTGFPVFIGHWAETMAYEQKKGEVARFFDPNTDRAWRQSLLETHGISYVWVGPREGNGRFQPEPFLTPVYQNATITIYQVQPN